MARHRRPTRVLHVLQSFKQPTALSNPYVTQLLDGLDRRDDVSVLPFSWRAAFFTRIDVFHAHWPEALIERRGRVSTIGRQALYGLFLLRLALGRSVIVRTVHNIELPQDIGRVQRALLRATERRTRMRIVLNEFTPVRSGQRSALIPHGHYRDWFTPSDGARPRPGSLLFFGKVRRYKNVDGLVRAFESIDRPDVRLRVLGSPSSAALADELRGLAGTDERIRLDLGYAEDDELVAAAGEAELVVLPYPEMHNSGSVLAALSLGRPVLVPDNDFNRALAEEVGDEWVLRFSGPLTAEAIASALDRAAERDPASSPRLDARDWDQSVELHVRAYRAARSER